MTMRVLLVPRASGRAQHHNTLKILTPFFTLG
jgi:hypothetical protein